MKTKIMQFFLFLALVVAASSVSNAAAPYHLNIPFDFTVNGKLMKAGTYSISFGISNANMESFLIRSSDGKSAAIVSRTATERTDEKTEGISVVFEKNGGTYSLSKISSSDKTIQLYKENNHFPDESKHIESKIAQ